MIVATNGRTENGGGMFTRSRGYRFDTPEALDVLRRVDAATCSDVGDDIDRDQHIEQIALVCLRAKGLA